MIVARKTWVWTKKIYRKKSSCKNELKQAWNTYYHIIRKAKKNVNKTFYKVKIQTQKFTQITKTDARQFSNILNLSISK